MAERKTLSNSKPLTETSAGHERTSSSTLSIYVLYLPPCLSVNLSQACGASLGFHHFTVAEAQRSSSCWPQGRSTKDTLIPNPGLIYPSFQQLFGGLFTVCESSAEASGMEPTIIIYKAFSYMTGALPGVGTNTIPICSKGKL